MKDEIERTENTILRALWSLPENSLRDDHNIPSAEITDGGNVKLVQITSRGPESDQENFYPNELFIGAQPQPYSRYNFSLSNWFAGIRQMEASYSAVANLDQPLVITPIIVETKRWKY